MAAHFLKSAFDVRLAHAMAPLEAEFCERFQGLAQKLRSGSDLTIEVPPLQDLVRRHLAGSPKQTWREAVKAIAVELEQGREA